ncbi:MAG: putative 4-hydroxybenzoate polyprenyltransferase [Rikenellaceae bacterium]|nr:putative 4-hydroxybenzoate polyprenyltransferase [Rikenellaceae bacterium]
MLSAVKKYASLVKFSHTVFAMPFALISFFYAYVSNDIPFDIVLLLKILLCMIFARNAAMGFNRYADREIDSKNPRTKNREIPTGKISERSAIVFIIINCILFISTTFFINNLAFYLSPVALVVILGYSLTKRFTSLCHLFIGLSLSIAPIGAYIAVTGRFAIIPLILSALVLTWVGGFDIIYSLQDSEFDRENGINSMPSRIGIRNSLRASSLLHLLTIGMVIIFGYATGAGLFYMIGSIIFISLLIYQHIIVKPGNLSRINLAFGTVNGIASICFAVFVIIDILIR